MIKLTNALHAWGSPDFEGILKAEIEATHSDRLPLQQGLSASTNVTETPHKVMILSVADVAGFIRVKAGIFYSGIIAGCSCADDPTPVSEQSEYCEVQIQLNKQTAEATVSVLAG
jgi:hypothetical protein